MSREAWIIDAVRSPRGDGSLVAINHNDGTLAPDHVGLFTRCTGGGMSTATIIERI